VKRFLVEFNIITCVELCDPAVDMSSQGSRLLKQLNGRIQGSFFGHKQAKLDLLL
jgi:hypothetical protein